VRWGTDRGRSVGAHSKPRLCIPSPRRMRRKNPGPPPPPPPVSLARARFSQTGRGPTARGSQHGGWGMLTRGPKIKTTSGLRNRSGHRLGGGGQRVNRDRRGWIWIRSCDEEKLLPGWVHPPATSKKKSPLNAIPRFHFHGAAGPGHADIASGTGSLWCLAPCGRTHDPLAWVKWYAQFLRCHLWGKIPSVKRHNSFKAGMNIERQRSSVR